ncbi:MAG: phosphate ABC transporter substrate-binding protein [Erysipelotrichaceae bacterium]
MKQNMTTTDNDFSAESNMRHLDSNHQFGRFIRKTVGFCLLIFVVSLTSACSKTAKSGIIIAGSTSVQPFAEALAEEYMKLNKGLEIDVQGGGSAAGIMSAQTNTADIGMSSRNLTGDEKKLWYVEIARDGLAVIVNPKNPVANLTLAQCRDIYSGAIHNWSQLGGTDHEIHVIAREEGSGTRSAFESLVMNKLEINSRAIIQDSNGTVRQLVGDDFAAIGFISLGLVNDKVKALELNGVQATRENVINGTYNLSRPFLFITNTEPTGKVKAFIDYVLSAEGKKLLNAEGLVTFADGGTK